MATFPGYTLESLKKLTLIQYGALLVMAAEIIEKKARATQL